MLDLQDIVPMGSYRDQENQIMLKGKRTKRKRAHSSIPFLLAANSTYHHEDGYNSNQEIMSSDSSAELCHDNTDQEEEDMANCLILLAQGHHSRQPPPVKQLHEDAKFASRRYLEAASASSGSKAGFYVYECKTCSRTFPSFQALGGHRASHKKPKKIEAPEGTRQRMLLPSPELPSHVNARVENNNVDSSFSLQLSNIKFYMSSGNNNSKSASKCHECSICGAEFSSGQALGGHMRRHRGAVAPAAATATMASTPLSSLTPTDSEEFPVSKKPRNVLSLELDLNLPAPEVDSHRLELLFPLASKKKRHEQQTSLVLSASPTLEGCHN